MTVIITSSRANKEDLIMSKLEKIEKAVVEGYQKIEDGFVGKFLTREGESVEETKARLAKEQYERTEKSKEYKNTHVEIPDSKEIVKKKHLPFPLNAAETLKFAVS